MQEITYGEYIKKRRVELGLSQSDLAKVLSCSYQAISKYENDLVNIDLSFASKLANALEVDVESFLLKKYEKNNDFASKYTFDNEKFAKSIVYLREKNMISQKDLAKKLNFSSTRLSKIEQGNGNTRIDEFLKLADFFGVNITSFYYTVEETELNGEKESKKNKFLKAFENQHFTIPFTICLIGLLALAISLPLSLANYNKEDIYEVNQFSYEEDENGLAITEYKGGVTEQLIVPSEIDGKKVHTVKANTFDNEDYIRELVFEEGIETIESHAYNFCASLKKVSLPSTLKTLGPAAFGISYSLETIEVAPENPYFTVKNGALYSKDLKELYRLPPKLNEEEIIHYDVIEGVEVIKTGAFDSNYSLMEITFPSTLKEIETSAFIDCYSIKEFNFNEGLEKLGTRAISGSNKSLANVYLPSTLKELDGNPLYNCPQFQGFTLNENNPYFEIKDNAIYSQDLKVLYAFPFLYENPYYKVPEGVEVVKKFAFNFLSNVSNIMLPSTIDEIDKWSIYSCVGLENIYIQEGAQNFKSQTIHFCPDSNVYLEYETLPESFNEDFCDGDIFYKKDWVEPGVTF